MLQAANRGSSKTARTSAGQMRITGSEASGTYNSPAPGKLL